MQTLVLSVGTDAEILDARDLTLRSAGYIVVSATSVEEAVHIFQEGDFDVIVVCHTLPQKGCVRLASFIRASGSRIPIVCVSGTVPCEHKAFADVTLDRDPVVFLACLGDVVRRRVPTQRAVIAGQHIDGAADSGKAAPRFDGGAKRQNRGTAQNREGKLSSLER